MLASLSLMWRLKLISSNLSRLVPCNSIAENIAGLQAQQQRRNPASHAIPLLKGTNYSLEFHNKSKRQSSGHRDPSTLSLGLPERAPSAHKHLRKLGLAVDYHRETLWVDFIQEGCPQPLEEVCTSIGYYLMLYIMPPLGAGGRRVGLLVPIQVRPRWPWHQQNSESFQTGFPEATTLWARHASAQIPVVKWCVSMWSDWQSHGRGNSGPLSAGPPLLRSRVICRSVWFETRAPMNILLWINQKKWFLSAQASFPKLPKAHGTKASVHCTSFGRCGEWPGCTNASFALSLPVTKGTSSQIWHFALQLGCGHF